MKIRLELEEQIIGILLNMLDHVDPTGFGFGDLKKEIIASSEEQMTAYRKKMQEEKTEKDKQDKQDKKDEKVEDASTKK